MKNLISVHAALLGLVLLAPVEGQFVQQGQKLVGTGAIGSPNQGISVALSADGNTAVVGGNVDNNLTGAVWVYVRHSGTWSQQGQKLVGVGSGPYSQQGQVAMSADGNTILVGGSGDDNTTGAAWVFTRNNGVWNQHQQKLVGTGGSTLRAGQGHSVALSADGRTAAVGGPFEDLSGAVWIFTLNNGLWLQQGERLVGTGVAGSLAIATQGASIALSASGNTLVVGGSNDNDQKGAIWVFVRNGGVWSQQGEKLVGTGGSGQAVQGYSVAISADGNTAATGGYEDSGQTGAVWVYTRTNGLWSQQGQPLVGTGAIGVAGQGTSVALSADGNTLIEGGGLDNNQTGAFWSFKRNNGVWTQQGLPTVGTGAAGPALQGFSVALAADGNTALIGGIGDFNTIGAAWVFVQPAISVTKTHIGNFNRGQVGVTYTIVVSNSLNGAPTSGDPVHGEVAVTDPVPAALSNLRMAGTGWTCAQNGCTRSDVLKPGSSYSPITVTADVGPSALSFFNTVNVDYGGTLVSSASDPTPIATADTPQLAMTLSHGSNFTQGQTNGHYSVSITNFGLIPVAGITVTETLPDGLTLASIQSPSWSCVGTTCSLNSLLQPGGSAQLDVYVNVLANAPSSVDNQVTLTATGLGLPIVKIDATGINPLITNPILVTAFPTIGIGSTESFTFTFQDANGYQDIAGAQIAINSTLTALNSCYILFARPDVISLAGDAGFTFQSTSVGAPAALQNSQCVVLASLTSQTGSGNTVSLTVKVVFKPGFAGAKIVWVNYNNVAGSSQGYQALGTYTATAPATEFSSSFTPVNNLGNAFQFTYFDPMGAPDISGAQVVFNSTLTGTKACYLLFSASNNVSLASDDATTFSTAILGQQTVLRNSQCTVFPGFSSQTQSGQTLIFTVFVTFNSTFAGKKNVYSNVNNNAGTSSGFTILGTWVATGLTGITMSNVSAFPVSGASLPLSFFYGDEAGAADIASVQVIVHNDYSVPSVFNTCAIEVIPRAGSISLATDDGLGVNTAILGQAVILQNSRCIVNAASSSQLISGNYLALTLFVTMKIPGAPPVYTSVSGFKDAKALQLYVGRWNVNSAFTMSPVSVTPLTGTATAGTKQFMTFTLSNPVGADDISGALIVLYPSLQGARACYILWGHGNNLISLADDNALSFMSGTAGTTGLLTNSQCTVDPSQSFSVQTGNTVNLTIAVAFKAIYRQFTQLYSWVNVQNAAHELSGWSLLSRFTVQ